MRKITVKRNFGDVGGVEHTLSEIKDIIMNDVRVRQQCDVLRSGKIGGVDADEITLKGMKDSLPKMEVSAMFDGSRNADNIRELTGYMAVDLDDKSVDFDAVRQKLMLDKELNPILIFTSPRGKLKFVIRLKQLESCGLSGRDAHEFHKKMYRQIVIYMIDRYNICPDLGTGDATRFTYISHDDNPYYYSSEPYCNIPFYPIDDEKIVERYNMIFNDHKEGGSGVIRQWSGDFDAELYREKLDRLREDLMVDADGDYIYDRTHREFIGSVSGGTAVLNIDGYMGYQLKWRLNVVALWLYNGDVDKANAFIRSSFTDACDISHPWNPCCSSHLSYPPCWNLCLWVLKSFGFKSLHKVPVTEVKYFSDCAVASGSGEDITVAEEWEDLMREHNLPVMLDRLMKSVKRRNPEKDTTLYSFLTVLGGFASRQEVAYNHGKYGLNLILNVIGTTGTGKGSMNKGVDVLLPSLNTVAEIYNKDSQELYGIEMADYNRRKRRKKDDADDMERPPKRPPIMVNVSANSTIQGLCGVLQDNNGKFVLVNAEYSNLIKSESGQYGGLLSYFKDIFDNQRIGIDTNNGIQQGVRNIVACPNCSILLSGTFDQFPKLYKNSTDGLLTRSMYYILPTIDYHDYEPPKQEVLAEDSAMLEIENEFIQWHYWCALHPENRRLWKLRAEDEVRYNAVLKDFVIKYCDLYVTRDLVGVNIQGFMFRLAHNAVRISALLSSLALFEREYWNRECDADNLTLAGKPILWHIDEKVGVCEVFREYRYEDYVNVQCGGNYSDDLQDLLTFNHVNVSYIPYEYMIAALKLIVPSIIHGVRMMETFRGDSIDRDMNPLESNPIYVALNSCPDEFSFSDYKDNLAKLRNGKNTYDVTVTRALKRLVEEKKVRKSDKTYKKIS